ncbi:hypothetical protein J8L85_12630 [Maribacter sp. MMG018]|uniref:hypothetical protein n=1 Tax=Maribacter sp. MMG018 TaxID=2822688 RepID=UPI001B39C339|nr:hypothetical protein [Maribacter sp. MMG018]MBQ4915290.1 hypothetical protein [Maribacter sp. MMG018]
MEAINERIKKGLGNFFTTKSTKSFIHDMNNALKAMEDIEVIRVLLKYNIVIQPEVTEFLEAYHEMMNGWQKKGKVSVVVGDVSISKSRCAACLLGKSITVYGFEYKHSEAEFPYNRIVYKYDFGMAYDVREGILYDLMICNSFLSKNEMQELDKIC